MKIGILGGTFDPVHKGHLNIANFAMQACKLDEVWFIPCSQNPLKPEKSMATDQQRIDMIQLAIKDYAQFRCDAREIKRQGPSYTIDTLRELTQEQPKTEFYFIMSTDVYKQLDEWKESDALSDYTTFIVTQRPGETESINITHDKTILLQTDTVVETSGTNIRNQLHKNKHLQALLPSSVLEYIQQHDLYHV